MVKKLFFNEQIMAIYQNLFNKVFKSQDIKEASEQAPAILYLVYENENIVGFVSGYPTNKITFYIQYAGMLKEYRGHKTLSFFMEATNKIHGDFQRINCMIKNNNIAAIKIALTSKFIINGIKQDKLKNLFVELTREVCHG